MGRVANDRVYRLYAAASSIGTDEFGDTEGDLLCSMHGFDCVEDAFAWVEQDIAQRRLLL